MSSLAFSLAPSTPRRQNNSSCSSSCSLKLIKNEIRRQSSQITRNYRVPSSVEISRENDQKLVGRREALVLGGSTGIILSAGILSFFHLSVAEAKASEEGSNCDQFTVAPNGLAFCDKLVGFGPQPSQGQLIKAHYVGKLEDGKVFDSSYNRGKPLTFRVGVGEVIKGWDQGILGTEGVPPMLMGGKRRLKIPPELGYGIRGAGCRGGSCIIPPNSVLYFDVEFVGKA